ncbi:Nif3-like dinuclear metal center hexameric protein [Aidingimonas halophila]|uniref:Dinuclear metal center protein, YbgI/SA1388 family n=1 Tax=Aidingimonas halophila TaxID=574349 RepID=A0A1H2QWM6_9GAMM|nr:Nif3-like dinuclear metal center hexameric protein [Aidingimonas halophila]GHC20183.1 GTP cyclohydrolase 1 type 2 [Aidingimonas halophila]SDW11328.1 dinuclear metal center protein, YbgI/SA1388 family [Aidingimonas halophila]
MISRDELVEACETQLQPDKFKDFTVNGLQVAGTETVQRIMTGVTACQALLDEAVAWGADALLVHHGYFWKNEPVNITGMKRHRIATLLTNDINLMAYHLPLDAHPTLGNNARLAELMGFDVDGCADAPLGEGLLWLGAPKQPLDDRALAARLQEKLGRAPLLISGNDRPLTRIAWCTGGAQDMIAQAAESGAQAFISGEISERTTHMAREMGISYLAAGHHATERGGIKALGEWLATHLELEHRFVDIDNPA